MRRHLAPILRVGIVGLAAVSMLLVAPASAQAASKSSTPTVTVMTRNLYLGANLIPLATTPPGAAFQQLTTQMFAGVKSEDPHGRMKLVAREIAKAKPDVVGLQEVSLWRTGPQPAKKVAFDYLADIQKELKRLHQSYRVVTVKQGLNIEGPMAEGNDVRLTLGNAVLARNGVKVTNARSVLYKNQLVIPTQAIGSVTTNRSYDVLDVTKKNATVHVVNTQIEAFSTDLKPKQANELIAGPLQSKYPTILIGDLNTGPTLPKPADRPAYLALAAAGFVPTRTQEFNCCYKGVKDRNQKHWDHNVDWIMSKPALTLVNGYVTGTKTTPAGIHPGDHGGVVSVITMKA